MTKKDNQLTTFYIVRHGQTEWNVQKRLQGQKDSPLTELGIQQAHDVRGLLKDVKFDAIYSSDALRAKRTGEIISLERQLEVVTSELLRERAFGKYEGMHVSELKKFDEIFEKLTEKEKFLAKIDTDIENDAEVAERFMTLIRELAIRFPGKTILLVTHAGIMGSFLVKTGFGTYKSLPHGSIINTSYIKIATDGIDFFLKETYGIKFASK